MNRFQKVIEILDKAVGGPGATVGFPHGSFWRRSSRDEFVAIKVLGLPLIVLGSGRDSNLVKALRGQVPFGADLDGAPAEAIFNRMPSGLDPVPSEEIDFIQRWIDDGCPEDEVVAERKPEWRRTNAPVASSRTNDIWFVDIARVAPAPVAELMATEDRNIAWLHTALQTAIQLELATLPPYLTARWTVKQTSHPVARSIHAIRGEEMLHFGLACNLLSAIGGSPLIADERVVPKYPGPLPGGVRPGLTVAIRKLDRDQARVFMEIEYPHGGPIPTTLAGTEKFDTIGQFYRAVLEAFIELNPAISTDRQLEGSPGVFKIDSLEKVKEAIELINVQGEGSNHTPEEMAGDLAHYYRFAEIYHGRRLVQDSAGAWSFSGPEFVLPAEDVHDMADIPEGGYQRGDVPDTSTWELIERFDRQYSSMLRLLEQAWLHGDQGLLGDAVGAMFAMGTTGRQLVAIPRPGSTGNYGPCFRFVSGE